MPPKSPQKKRGQKVRRNSYARDIGRYVAPTELMGLDSIGQKLTATLAHLSIGYDEDTTRQALELFGLGEAACVAFRQLYGERPPKDRCQALVADLARYRDELCKKYQISELRLPDEVSIEIAKAEIVLELCEEQHLGSFKAHDTSTLQSLQGPFKTGFHAWLQHAWGPGTGWSTMQYAANWLPTRIPPLLKNAECYKQAIPLEQLLQAKQPPILTMVVRLSKVVIKIDKTRLAEHIKAIIKHKLQSLPSPRVKDPQQARQALTWTSSWNPSAIRTDQPPCLTFTLDCSQVNQRYLKTLTEWAMAAVEGTLADMPKELRKQWQEPAWMKGTMQGTKFAQKVRRYRWYYQYGCRYRSIAWGEQLARRTARQAGRKFDEELELPWHAPAPELPQPIKVKIRREGSVAREVKQIRDILLSGPSQEAAPEPESPPLDLHSSLFGRLSLEKLVLLKQALEQRGIHTQRALDDFLATLE